MGTQALRRLGLLVFLGAASCASAGGSPESRAVAFLAREVPDWPTRNRCFSCHNNGDGARALWAARQNALGFDPKALDSTVDWLAQPDRWRTAGPPGDASDRRLAVLQFAWALGSSPESKPAGRALARACELLAEFQEPDGSWAVDSGGLPGSPVTYGRTLATVAARSVLARGGSLFAGARARAEAWLAAKTPVTVLDAAALLLGPADPRQGEACLDLIRRGEAADGGWGPYVTSPPEVFDTALVLLALAPRGEVAGASEMRRRGRRFLVRAQKPDGSWPETTRPPGQESYAQRISTTGWATLALLATP